MPVHAKTLQPTHNTLTVRQLGTADYIPVWEAMQAFTDERTADTCDELWLVEHPPVFTLGRNGKTEHIHDAGDIPVVHVDRGGQVSYHGPGQLVAYPLLDLKRRRIGVATLVKLLEQAVINLLHDYHVTAQRRDKAPGVYVADCKIAALGLRVRRGCSYHGLSLNVDMDTTPFTQINPCGIAGLEVTQMTDLGISTPLDVVAEQFTAHLGELLDNAAHG